MGDPKNQLFFLVRFCYRFLVFMHFIIYYILWVQIFEVPMSLKNIGDFLKSDAWIMLNHLYVFVSKLCSINLILSFFIQLSRKATILIAEYLNSNKIEGMLWPQKKKATALFEWLALQTNAQWRRPNPFRIDCEI